MGPILAVMPRVAKRMSGVLDHGCVWPRRTAADRIHIRRYARACGL